MEICPERELSVPRDNARQSRPAQQAQTLLVIPTYNEAGNLERLVREIAQQGVELDLLIIDDHSPDGTGTLAETLSTQFPMRVIHRPRKLGIGSAHRRGFDYALAHGYPSVITMDADFAHGPEYLPMMLAQVSSADVIIASRYLRGGGLSGWQLYRRLLTHTAHWLTTRLLGLPYDCTGGFRLYKTRILQAIDFSQIHSDGYAFLIELAYQVSRTGCSIREIPIVINSRHTGVSKISRHEILNAVKTLVRLSLRRLRGQ